MKRDSMILLLGLVVLVAMGSINADELKCFKCEKRNCKEPVSTKCEDDVKQCIIGRDANPKSKNSGLIMGCAEDIQACDSRATLCCGTDNCNTKNATKSKPKCEECTNCPTDKKTKECDPGNVCFAEKKDNKIIKGCAKMSDDKCKGFQLDKRCCRGSMCNTKDLFETIECVKCDDEATCKTAKSLSKCAADESACFVQFSGRKIVKKGCVKAKEAEAKCTKPDDIKKKAKDVLKSDAKTPVEFTGCCAESYCNKKPKFPVRSCRKCGGKSGKACDADNKKAEETMCSGYESLCFQKKNKDGKVEEMGCAENAASGCDEASGIQCCHGDDCNVASLVSATGAGQTLSSNSGIVGFGVIAAIIVAAL